MDTSIMQLSRNCFNCTQVINSNSTLYEWQTKEFCCVNCFASTIAFDEQLDCCFVCKNNVSESIKVKLCVRFGSVYEQFCSHGCMDSFKSSSHFCKLCQEQILSFMVIFEEEKFCSPFCVSRWGGRGINQIYFVNENPCYICEEVGIHHFEMLKDVSVFFCSKQCIEKYNKEETPVKAVCALCGCLLLASFNHFYRNGVLSQFCSRQCSNIYIVMKAKIVSCIECKVKKYCFDMIKKHLLGKIEYYCSLTCLHATLPSQLLENESSDISKSCDQVHHPILKVRTLDQLNEGGIIVDIDNENSSEESKEVSSFQTVPLISDDVFKEKWEDLYSRFCPPMVSKSVSCQADSKSSATQFDETVNAEKEVQTDQPYSSFKGIPIPFPVYIPTPMQQPRYRPSPLIIPVPVPFPFPIPLLDRLEENQSVNQEGQKCSDQIIGADDEGEFFDASLSDIVSMCGLSDLIPVDEVVIDDSSLIEPGNQRILSEVGREKILPRAKIQAAETLKNLYSKDKAKVASSKKTKCLVQFEAFLKNKLLEDQAEDEYCQITSQNHTQGDSSLVNLLSQEDSQDTNLSIGEFTENRSEDEDSLIGELTEYRSQLEDYPESDSPQSQTHNDYPTRKSPLQVQAKTDVSLVVTPPQANTPTKPSSASKIFQPIVQIEPLSASQISQIQFQTKTQSERPSPSQLLKESKDSVSNESVAPKCSLINEETLTCKTRTLDGDLGRSLWAEFVLRKSQDKTVMKKVSHSDSNFITMSNSDRNIYLIAFVSELLEEKEYHPNIIIYVLLCIQKYFSNTTSIDSIFLNIVFQRFGKVFYNIIQTYMDKFNGIIPFLESTRVYSGLKIRESMLWESQQLGSISPSVLLFTVMYFNTKLFKFHTLQEHELISFQRMHKFSNTRYLKDGTPVVTRSLRYISSSDNEKKIRRELFEDLKDPQSCPYKIHEFYANKCPAEAIRAGGNFYLTPILGCCYESKIWFSSRRLPSSTLRNILTLALMVDDMQEDVHDFYEDSVQIICEN